MNCDNCRWFNKTGFAPGFGDCVLNREVHGSNHVCKNYEEYKAVQHGEWEVQYFDNTPKFFICSNCNFRLTYRYNFCPCCGSDNRS